MKEREHEVDPSDYNQAGIQATVYEHKTTRLREWGMTLNSRNEALARLLPAELQSRLKEICCDPGQSITDHNTLPHYAGQTGELLIEQPGPHEMRVSRSKMRQLFGEGIDVRVRLFLCIIHAMPYHFADPVTTVRQTAALHHPMREPCRRDLPGWDVG